MKSIKAQLQEFARGCYLNYEVALESCQRKHKFKTPREKELAEALATYWQQRCAFYYAAARMCNEDET